MLRFSKTKAKKEHINQKETNSSEYIPYRCHWDSNTLLTKGEELVQVIKLEGFAFETADDEDVDIMKNMRNLLYKNLASGSVSLYFHTLRKKRRLGEEEQAVSIDPYIKRPNDFVTYLQQEWQKKYSNIDSYVNELYITVVFKEDTQGAAVVNHYRKKLQEKSNPEIWQENLKELVENLYEVTTRIISTFKDYNPSLLGVTRSDEGDYCEILSFLSSIINCGKSHPVLLSGKRVDEQLARNRLFFGSRSMEIRGASGSKFAGIVSIREYGPSTNAGIFDAFLQMPFEFIMTQSFNFTNRQTAISAMQLQQNRMIQAEDKAVSQIHEISEALDMATSGQIGFGQHHLTILCFEDDLKTLENTLSMATVELSNCGIQAVREGINLEPSFWGQLPGNNDFIVRKSTVNTLNLSGFASNHNYPTGKKYGNHWGEYVSLLDTTSGTPYYFNFHVRDIGHTMIIGPTGAGKTVLMNFLCAQAQKFQCRTYFFDKDRGAEIFIRALNGVYTVIDPGQEIRFNPLQLPDTGENRGFLLEWLKLLVSVNGETVSSEETKLLQSAIEGNYKLPKHERVLRNIVPFLGIQSPGSLASRIEMWHSKGSYANVFDNVEDSIDLEEARVFGFEMGNLLKDPISLGPVLLYLFHRINSSLDGTPTMIVLDEAWALIDNPIFGPKIKDWLKVLRKLNAFVIFATQSVEDASKSDISDTLIQQTATQIFLPNLKATEVYKTTFMLSEREFTLVKTTDPSTRYFLVKQGTNAVIARVNLAGMDDIINVLSGGSESVGMLYEIFKEYGEHPDDWLPVFYERAKEL
jgi:type IV secretion system protein VirB4